jgi:hypothetical protein
MWIRGLFQQYYFFRKSIAVLKIELNEATG